jgi:hypothetical protein
MVSGKSNRAGEAITRDTGAAPHEMANAPAIMQRFNFRAGIIVEASFT